MNPYAELGVPPDADIDAINAAYRRKARGSHPDAGGDPAAFARLSRAVAILRDPAERERFDRTGESEQPRGNRRGAAVEVLVQSFMEALASVPSLNRADIIAAVEARIREHQQAMKVERQRVLKAQRDNAAALERLSFAGAGPDFLRKALEDQATGIGRGLTMIEEREGVLADALAMAEDYDWQTDPQPEQQTTWLNINSFTGSAGI